MAEREYVCCYSHCLHNGEKVKQSESVIVGKKHYHLDCAATKQTIKECVDLYMEYIEDKSQYPVATKIINNLVFKSKVPSDFILNNIKHSQRYYSDKPVYVLYGLRKLFWEKEFKA